MAANQNVTQLTQQTGSAAASSLFYAVTGGAVDTGLPLNVLVNDLGLTGVPTTPTAALNTNTIQIASCAFVQQGFAPLASPTFTGTPSLPTGTIAVTQSPGNNSTAIATTAYVNTSYAPINSPTFTGTVTIPSGASISGYLTTAIAATTYAPLLSPALIGTLSVTNSATNGETVTISATSNTSHGASVTLIGNGATTPNKSIRVLGGVLQVLNSAYTVITTSLDDSGNLSTNGSITPSQTAGIIGTTTTNNANAGSVGEYLTNTTLTTSATNGAVLNATSMSLTAGDWDVSGVGRFNPAAGVTTFSTAFVGVSTTSATNGGFGTFTAISPAFAAGANSETFSSPVVRISLASTTTVYLVVTQSFTGGTMTVDGMIRARRVR